MTVTVHTTRPPPTGSSRLEAILCAVEHGRGHVLECRATGHRDTRKRQLLDRPEDRRGAKTVYHHHTAHGCKSTHELGRDISTGRDATALTSYLLEALHKPWALILGGIRLWHAGAVVALHRHRLALTRLPTSASVRFWNARESRTDVHATALPRELATSRALALEAPAHS